jgi:hypothetical protein
MKASFDRESVELAPRTTKSSTRKVIAKSNEIVVYDKFIGDRSKSKENAKHLEGVETYTGKVTAGARKRLKHVIDIFCQSTPERWVKCPYTDLNRRYRYKCSFLTLTIPYNGARIEGKVAYEILLSPFIKWLNRECGVDTYFWKAELQNPIDFFGKEKASKGQLHYHLCFPNWICKKKLQKQWNTVLEKQGLTKEYFKKYGSHNPPSLRIESPKDLTSIGNYLTKEVCKTIVTQEELDKLKFQCEAIEQKNPGMTEYPELKRYNQKKAFFEDGKICGKVWGCSDNLLPKKEVASTFEITVDAQFVTQIETFLAKKEVERNWQKVVYQSKQVYILKLPTGWEKEVMNYDYLFIPDVYSYCDVMKESTGVRRREKLNRERKKWIGERVGKVSIKDTMPEPWAIEHEKLIRAGKHEEAQKLWDAN